MTDKRLGYLLMLVILALASAVGYHFWLAYKSPHETRVLRFPQVGSLFVEDPVRMEGALVGEIVNFEHDDSGRVLVHVRSKDAIPIRTSSDVAVKVKGVMGERFIEITTGDLNDPLIPRGEIVDGRFEMGPSEAITYIDLLENKIIELRDIMQWLRDGRNDGKRPFIVAFNDIVNDIDTLVYGLLTDLTGMEDKAAAGMDSALALVDAAIRVTAEAARIAPKVVDDLGTVMEKADNLANKVDTLLARIEPIVARIDTSALLWGEDNAVKLVKLMEQMRAVRKYIEDLREEGLPLTVRLRVFKARPKQ